jgi:glycosyltransferase involved in cell wall biosynthesis
MMESISRIAKPKPMVSIVVPSYNEEAMILNNLGIVCDYMRDLENRFDWELICVNDGSTDKTGILAEEFSRTHSKVKVINHLVNMNLGNALKTGFANSHGEYIVTLDIDLSYATYHIGLILDSLESTQADIVIASPYMKGGKVIAVPVLRRVLSRVVNLFMRLAAQEKLHTFTGMVRGYRTEHIKSLNLKTQDYEINPEIIYKSFIMRAKIVEIPAKLDWTEQNKLGAKRTSGMKIIKTFFSGLMAGFIFRPYIFFLALGLILLFLALYILGWIFYNTFLIYHTVQVDPKFFDDRFSMAIGQVFKDRPHSFIVGGITFLASIQVLTLGFLSLQKKRYFEELFHLCTSIKNQKVI